MTPVWQTLHHTKISDALETFGHLFRGSWRHAALADRNTPNHSPLQACMHTARAGSLPQGGCNSDFIQPTPFPLINCFWEGEPFGRKCSAPLSAKTSAGQLFTGAVHRWGKVLFHSQVKHQPGTWPCCRTDLFVLSEYCCFFPFNSINNKKIKYPEITMHLTLFIKLYAASFYQWISAEIAASFPFLMQTSSNATSGVLLSSQGHTQIKTSAHLTDGTVEILSTRLVAYRNGEFADSGSSVSSVTYLAHKKLGNSL